MNDSQTRGNIVTHDLMSDEELTSYQQPRDGENCEDDTPGPGSPIFHRLSSSFFASSVQRTSNVKVEDYGGMSPPVPTKMVRHRKVQAPSVFKSLGMAADKDISWASSMESLVDPNEIRTDFNTVEKATFFPNPALEHVSQIQPRALFPTSSSESLPFKLNSSFENDEAYTKGMRLSDVCDVLKAMNVVSASSASCAPSDPYDFDVDNPSFFTPQRLQTSSIIPHCDSDRLSSSKNNARVCDFTMKSKAGSPVRSSTPAKELSVSSPSVFSPMAGPSKPQPFSPIPEDEALEDSELEIVLDGSIPKQFAESARKSTDKAESMKENAELCTENRDCQPKRPAAKCLLYKEEVQPESDKVDSDCPPVKCPRKFGQFLKKNEKKKMYGGVGRVELIEESEDDLLSSLIEIENASNQFLDSKKRNLKALPSHADVIKFSDFAVQDFEEARKRVCRSKSPVASADLQPNKVTTVVTSLNEVAPTKSMSIKEPRQEEKSEEQFALPSVPKRNTHVKTCGWTSNAQYLVDSQAEVTDTQIFDVVEAVEASFISSKNSNSLPPKRRPNSTKEPKKCVVARKIPSILNSEFSKTSCQDGLREADDLKSEESDPCKTKEVPAPLGSDNLPLLGFKTVNNAFLKPSDASLSRIRKLFEEDVQGCEIPKDLSKPDVNEFRISQEKNDLSSAEIFLGFRTGNESIVQPSEASLSKVKIILAEEDSKFEKDLKKSDQTFVGFRTGNNAIVKPSDKSLTKVRTLLSECEENLASNLEQPSFQQPFVEFRTGNNVIVKPSDKSLTKVRKLLSECEVNEESSVIDSKQAGLTSRNDEVVKPSDESFSKVRELCAEGDPDNTGTDISEVKVQTAFVGFRTGNNAVVKPSERSLSKVRKLLSECEPIDGPDISETNSRKQPPAEPPFAGYRTGNNTIVKPSDESLSKVRKLLSECEHMDKPDISETNSRKQPPAEPPFSGFRTGNNAVVKPTEKSLSKVRKLLSDCEPMDTPDISEANPGNPVQPSFAGFRTGNHNIVKPSDESLSKVRKLLSECEPMNGPDMSETNPGNLVPPPFVGFRTGNNIIVKPSDESLSKVRKLLSECEPMDGPEISETNSRKQPPAEPTFAGFRTGKNTIVKPSDESLSKVRKLLSECEPMDGPDISETNSRKQPPAEPPFAGFRTGNNAIIKPSDESLSKVRKLLSECEPMDGPDISETNSRNQLQAQPPFAGFRTGNNSVVKPSERSLSKVRKLLSECEPMDGPDISETNSTKQPPAEPPFAGFRTGKNSVVKPSGKSLSKVRKLLSEFEPTDGPDISEVNPGNPVQPSFAGFRTGNNIMVKPSDESLSKVRKLLSECESVGGPDISEPKIENQPSAQPLPFAGFRTGNNAIVKPSDESLSKVRKLLSDCEPMDGPDIKEANPGNPVQPSFAGFRTGNNNIVKPSDESLSKVRKLLSECEPMDEPGAQFPSSSSFQGFKTGNNASIELSKKSLSKAKKILSDCESIEETVIRTNGQMSHGDQVSFVGFKTGDSKLVQPSSAALDRVRKMFSESEAENQNRDENGKEKTCQPLIERNKITEIDEKVGMGFTSGRGVTMKVSDQSLARMTKIFEECDDNEVKGNSENQGAAIKKAVHPIAPVSKTETPEEHGKQLSQPNESYSALLVSGDWDDTILPSWFNSSQLSKEEETADLNVTTGSKRPSSEVDQGGCKRYKSMDDHRLKLIREERELARRKQSRMGGKMKGKVRPQPGSLIEIQPEKKMTWLQALPEGPGSFTREELLRLGVENYILDITTENAKHYRFEASRYYSSEDYENNSEGILVGDDFRIILEDDNTFGAAEVERAFLAGPGVAPDLVPVGWVAHHYGLIVWKLACYEFSCQSRLAKSSLTPGNLMLYLKYRYDREIDRSKSSALKRILERDDPAGKAVVLTVMRIKKLVEGIELLLTDGWYTCPARADVAMERAVRSGKLTVGTKLMTLGAELVGCEQGCHPLEMNGGVYLKIATNSTRRVRWFHKMGFQMLKRPPHVSLASILPGGGNVACLRVETVRTYPIVYVEKTSEGRNVTRNARAEHKAAAMYQAEQEALMERTYSAIQKEMDKKPKRRATRGRLNVKEILKIENPEELVFILENAPDPASIEAQLSDSQKCSIRQYQENCRNTASREVQERLKSLKVEQRSVRSVLRVRLVDVDDKSRNSSAVLSWWQPPEELVSLLTEGKTLLIFNVTPGSSRNQQQNQIYLNTTRQTRIELFPAPHGSLPTCSRNIYRISDISPSLEPPFGELDIVGLVVFVHNPTPNSPLQTVYLTDSGQNFFGLIFWRGLQEFCCEDSLAEGLVVGVSNVQWRRSSGSGAIPVGHVTETSVFAQHSKFPLMQTAIDELKEELEEEDIAQLIERCQDLITTKLHTQNLTSSASAPLSFVTNTSVTSPSPSLAALSTPRRVQSDSYVHRSNVSSLTDDESPSARPRYLNGFAQRPRASSTPVKSRTPVQWRLEKLQMMGEPPPLSPIASPLSRRVTRSFKIPTEATDSPPLDL